MSKTLSKELPKLLKTNPELKFLEVGCGSGINLVTAKNAGVRIENILGVDVNIKAVSHCKSLGFNCIKSNLFNNIKGKFDVIIFNPPYLPLDKKEPKISRRETTGGKKGNEIIIRFLKQAGKHLTKDGRIFIITSSLAQEINFDKLGYKAKKLNQRRLFFERLSCWELSLIKTV